MRKKITVFFILLAFCTDAFAFTEEQKAEEQKAQEKQAKSKDPLTIFIPVGYEYMRVEEQSAHRPAGGIGFMIGEQDLPFTEVERRFFGIALYQPLIFAETPEPGIPKLFHEIDLLLDARINRHQLLLIFQALSDRPVAGGLDSIQIGAAWGYEVIRKQHVSLILGAALAVSDFGITLPSGSAWPALPLSLIRFGVDTKWFASSFDFLTGPNFEFTVAPKSRIRFSGDMRMDNYRSIDDIICEFTLWYRFFDSEHEMGDFAGIGIGIKNEVLDFTLDASGTPAKYYGFMQRAIFAALDLSIVKIQGGRVFDSCYLLDGEKTKNTGRGFFISVQGIVPISIK